MKGDPTTMRGRGLPEAPPPNPAHHVPPTLISSVLPLSCHAIFSGFIRLSGSTAFLMTASRSTAGAPGSLDEILLFASCSQIQVPPSQCLGGKALWQKGHGSTPAYFDTGYLSDRGEIRPMSARSPRSCVCHTKGTILINAIHAANITNLQFSPEEHAGCEGVP